MSAPINNKKMLGVFSLVMIAVVSVDSLRNLPIGAQYGYSLITLYALAGITFFFPLTWIAGKLAASYPITGGSYIWVEKAFGKSFGNLAIWLLWVYNMIWYPTIFVFINTTLASLIAPGLENSKWFILLSSLGFFWVISLVHCFGIRVNSWISILGALVGTLLPMFLIIGLAGYWLMSGHVSATEFNPAALLPNAHTLKNLGFFSNILFSLVGLEVIAMYAGNVINPTKTYPRALIISAILILFSIALSSLALCIIMPSEKIALTSGLMDVFQLFFATYHFNNGAIIIGFCIVIGGLAIASSWMIALARGLQVALGNINPQNWLQQNNKNQMPAKILFFQAIIYSVLLCAFLFFPNINNSYWILSALTSQFALLYYVLLFCAAIKLLQLKKQNRINNLLNMFLPGIACVICIAGIVVGFLPPEQIPAGSTVKFILMMIACFVIMGALPFLIISKDKKLIPVSQE